MYSIIIYLLSLALCFLKKYFYTFILFIIFCYAVCNRISFYTHLMHTLMTIFF